MAELKAFKVDFSYKNSMQLLDTVIYLFSKTVLKTELSPREISILRIYLAHGYSPKVKKGICIDLEMNATTLNTNNCKLQAKGFLSPHPTSQRLKLINEELLQLKDCFINEDNKSIFVVNFIKDNVR